MNSVVRFQGLNKNHAYTVDLKHAMGKRTPVPRSNKYERNISYTSICPERFLMRHIDSDYVRLMLAFYLFS